MRPKEWRYTIKVTGGAVARRQFVYRVPVDRPVQVDVPFYADTPENQAIRYAMACAGYREDLSRPCPAYDEVVDVLVRQREVDSPDGVRTVSVQVWLIANKYTEAQASLMVGWFTLRHSIGLDYANRLRELRQSMVARAVLGV